jgi:hypothetical protein
MKHTPITRQKSPWEPMANANTIGGVEVAWWQRRVADGLLIACVAPEPQGWHLSISFRNHRGDLTRYPQWDEIAHARDELLPDDVDFVMHLPKAGEYVALHDTTFHLHQHPETETP